MEGAGGRAARRSRSGSHVGWDGMGMRAASRLPGTLECRHGRAGLFISRAPASVKRRQEASRGKEQDSTARATRRRRPASSTAGAPEFPRVIGRRWATPQAASRRPPSDAACRPSPPA
jgi:hypothetical protein